MSRWTRRCLCVEVGWRCKRRDVDLRPAWPFCVCLRFPPSQTLELPAYVSKNASCVTRTLNVARERSAAVAFVAWQLPALRVLCYSVFFCVQCGVCATKIFAVCDQQNFQSEWRLCRRCGLLCRLGVAPPVHKCLHFTPASTSPPDAVCPRFGVPDLCCGWCVSCSGVCGVIFCFIRVQKFLFAPLPTWSSEFGGVLGRVHFLLVCDECEGFVLCRATVAGGVWDSRSRLLHLLWSLRCVWVFLLRPVWFLPMVWCENVCVRVSLRVRYLVSTGACSIPLYVSTYPNCATTGCLIGVRRADVYAFVFVHLSAQ